MVSKLTLGRGFSCLLCLRDESFCVLTSTSSSLLGGFHSFFTFSLRLISFGVSLLFVFLVRFMATYICSSVAQIFVGKTKDTVPIQKALSSCSNILIPKGNFLTGPLNVSSNTIITLEGTLLGSTDLEDWPLVDWLPSYGRGRDKPGNISYFFGNSNSMIGPRYHPFIWAYKAVNVTINGSGEINGQSNSFWWEIKKKLNHTRPRLVEFEFAQHVRIEGIKLSYSPFWTLHIVYCDDVVVEGIEIYNPLGSPNTDGIDPDSSSNVLINNVDIRTSDDCISIKSGWKDAGYEFGRPSVNITVSNSRFHAGSGLAIGSETAGGVQNVLFANLTLYPLIVNAVRLKAAVGNGGIIKNVTYDNIYLEGVLVAFFANTCYECGSTPPPGVPATQIQDINVRNIKGYAGETAKIECTQDIPCMYWNFRDVDITSVLGWSCKYAGGTSGNVHPSPCF